MGANFINSVLEEAADTLTALAKNQLKGQLTILMSILSNYTPDCKVKAEVHCAITDLATADMSGDTYAQKFIKAIEVAEKEPYRAVTHNKGIMNGIDAVVIATGNDFRAVEANAHAYASKDGYYTSLSHAKIEGDCFYFWIEIPLAVGTVGGITGIHPLVQFSLQLLQKPSAKKLMGIIAATGLAQNFAAVNSLITSGIQQGHMKMHLNNLLNFLKANEAERQLAEDYFKDKKVSFSELKKLLKRDS
jgi:hydroxymethylglutaryl-CoA reductase